MKSFSAIFVSVTLACCAANASALQSGPSNFGVQDVCDVKYELQRNLASVLTDPTGVRTLNEVRESVKDMCVDPKAHNAIVDLLDVITDVATDPNVSQTLGNALFWARQVLKEKNFRVIWLEEMRGLNMVFDRAEATGRVSDAMYNLLEQTLWSRDFESSFDRVVSTLGRALKARNDNKVMAMAMTVASKLKYAGGDDKSTTARPGRAAAAQRPVVGKSAPARRPSAAAASRLVF